MAASHDAPWQAPGADPPHVTCSQPHAAGGQGSASLSLGPAESDSFPPPLWSRGVLLGAIMKAVFPPPPLLHAWQERGPTSFSLENKKEFSLVLLAKALLETSWHCYCGSVADFWQYMPKQYITLVACFLRGRTPHCAMDCHVQSMQTQSLALADVFLLCCFKTEKGSAGISVFLPTFWGTE